MLAHFTSTMSLASLYWVQFSTTINRDRTWFTIFAELHSIETKSKPKNIEKSLKNVGFDREKIRRYPNCKWIAEKMIDSWRNSVGFVVIVVPCRFRKTNKWWCSRVATHSAQDAFKRVKSFEFSICVLFGCIDDLFCIHRIGCQVLDTNKMMGVCAECNKQAKFREFNATVSWCRWSEPLCVVILIAFRIIFFHSCQRNFSSHSWRSAVRTWCAPFDFNSSNGNGICQIWWVQLN